MIITPKDAIALARGKLSYSDISRIMGKNESYISNALSRRTIGAQVMVDILDALGYDTIISNRNNGDSIRISPSSEDVIIPYSLTLSIKDESIRERLIRYQEDGTLETRLKEI